MVSRGGFHVGNGINWKGQVFSKMRNHTVTNRMTVRPLVSMTFVSLFYSKNNFLNLVGRTACLFMFISFRGYLYFLMRTVTGGFLTSDFSIPFLCILAET